MSERKKDERLIELMTEFLETKDPDQVELDEGFAHPGLDNKKMLDAIEGHRSEIEALKIQLESIKEKVAKQQVLSNTPIVVPEITALQTAIGKHNTQIGDLFYQQKMLKTDVDEEMKREKKKGGFGNLGWLLLLSNILLWSLVGYFLYKNGQSKNSQVVHKSNSEKRKQANEIKSEANAIIADSIALAQIEADSFAQRQTFNDKKEQRDSLLVFDEVPPNVEPLVGGATPVVRSSPVQDIAVAKVAAQPKTVIERRDVKSTINVKPVNNKQNTIAQTANKKSNTAKKQIAKKIKTAKVVQNKQAKPAKRTAVNSQPETVEAEPEVIFGD